jgi:hypothetical protein
LLLAATATALLLVGIAIGTSRSSRGPEPGMRERPSGLPMWSDPNAGAYRDEKQEERWRKVQEKLEDGDLKGAEKELRKILERDPDDGEARDLLERIRSQRSRGWRED